MQQRFLRHADVSKPQLQPRDLAQETVRMSGYSLIAQYPLPMPEGLDAHC